MSDAQAQEQQPVVLNEGQVERIITFATANKMMAVVPETYEQKLRDAVTLVGHARRAYANGNHDPRVTEVLFIAEVDQAGTPVSAQSQATTEVSTADAPVDPVAAFAPPQAQTNGTSTLDQFTIDQLLGMVEALRPNAGAPAVQAEIDKLEAHIAQRRAADAQQPSQVPPPAPQGAPAPPPGPSVPGPDAGQLPAGAQGPPVPPPAPPAPPADAAPIPAAQAPGEVAQGVLPQAGADEEARRRAELEAQVTGAMLVAYGRTFADVPQIPTEDLERMIATPGGPTVGVTTSTPVPPAPVQQQISPEREALIEKITGPMLKAWKSGRTAIPSLSDDQLKEMIAYPGGPSTRPQGDPFASQPAPAPDAQTAPPAPQTEQPAASPPAPTQPPAAPITSDVDALIARERLPIPPEVDQPPQLPFDISKISDEELRSTHGQFHAVLTRVNWVIAQHRDEIFGLKRALAKHKAVIREALPKTVDGKRITNDDKDAMVAADAEVVRLEDLIAEHEHPLIKLENIAESARSTCARCSRDWSMRKGERDPYMRSER